MVSLTEVEQVAKVVGRLVNAQKIILFGSSARGESTADSDIDLLVIAESHLPRHKRSREIYRRIRPLRFPLDILVVTPEEVQKANQTPLSFVSRVLREGKTLYER